MDKKKRGKKAAKSSPPKSPQKKRVKKTPPKSPTKKVVSESKAKKPAKTKKPVKRARTKVSRKRLPTPAKKLAPLRQAISTRKLPLKYRGLARTLRDIEENADVIDRLKKPGEFWGFEVDGIRSYAVYSDIELMVQDLGESAGIQFLFHRHQKAEQFWKDLKIVRWNHTATEWKPSAQKLTAKQLDKRRRNAARQVKRRNSKKK